jgi:CPA2 family monovalent cation:H+ antiporter-2
MAWAAARAGYSIALGAFTAGTLIAESGKGKEVDALVRPFRDAFAAIFFVAIGMMIDASLIADHWLAVIVLAVALVAAKSVAVTVAATLTGQGFGRAVEAGLALSQIGEYAFIVAAVGIAAGVARPMLLPIVVGAACLTAITGSWQVRGSERAATWVGGHLPRAAATFVSFYEAWIARLSAHGRARSAGRRIRQRAVWLVVDAAILVAIVIGAATVAEPIATVAAIAVGALFGFGAIRHAIGLARLLAAEIIPDGARGLDLGSSPRRALVVTLELAIALAVGLPVAIVVQPFVPGGGLVVVALVIALALVAHRSVIDFDRHVRAGSELIVEVLARQGRDPARPPPVLAEVEAILPGFEGLAAIALTAASPAVGRSLAELDLRARTGASVLAVTRGGVGLASPSPHDLLRAGDVLALAGSADALAAARALLIG